MDIVEELRRNPESGAKRLEAEYKAGLMTLASRFCDSPSDAEELVNRTFAAVVEGIDDYLEQSAFFGWMCQILRNIYSLDKRRKSAKNEVYPGEIPDVADDDAQEAIYRNLDRCLVRDALGKLDDSDREVLLLHYFLDIPIHKMAQILAVPAGTVKSRLHYARKALAAKLGAAAKKPAARALLLALALLGVAAFGAGASIAVARLLSPTPAAPEQRQADNSKDNMREAAIASAQPQGSSSLAGSTKRGDEGVAVFSTQESTTMNSRNLVSAGVAGAMLAATATAAELPAAPEALPASIQAKTALWLDASKNLVLDSSGNLVAWLDAREESVADEAAYESRVSSQDWTYPRAVVWTSGACPSDSPLVVTDGPASFGDKPYVDFGEYNQNYWLLFVDETTVRKAVPITGYAGFIGFGTTAGFVVGDVNDPDVAALPSSSVGNNGSQNWHKGAGGDGNDNIYSATDGNGRYGETRVNGRLVNSTATKHVRNGWEIFVENGPNSGGYVSTLFNNGNFKQAVSGNGDRQGGGKIAEIMLFSGMLTQSEVAEVEAYLRGRWQGGAGSANDVIVLSSGDTLAVDASTGPLFAGDIAGAGAIEKTGTGNFTIDRAGRLAAGPLTLRAGRVTSIGKRAHFPPLVAVGGVTVGAAASSLTATAAGDADTFTVNETTNRCVALAAAEAGVAKIAASKAAATLQPQGLPSDDVATAGDHAFLAQGNLIKNGSFEDDETTGYQSNASEWTLSRQSTSNSSIGVERWGSNIWANNNVVNTAKYQENVNPDTSFPDRNQCAFIQVVSPYTNSLNQTVTVTQPGLYRLSAWIRCRLRKSSYTDHSAVAWFAVDDVNILARRTGYSTVTSHAGYSAFSYTNSTPFNFRKVSVDLPLTAGEHTISIKASAPYGASGTEDRALCVDDVRLEPVAAGNFILVPNANFETMANQPGISQNSGIYRPSSVGFDVASWTLSNCGITRYPSSWFWNSTYDGTDEDQALYLGNLSGASSASQAISFPSDGRVRVSFRYANRTKNAINGAARASGQTLSVSLGGTQFFSVAVTGEDYITASAECDVSAGSQTLLFSNSANATILDDVRIEYVGGTDRAVEDVAFADNSSSWTYDGAVAESDAFGLRELVFTGSAQAEATFTVPSDGYYLLTFQSRGRPLSESGTSAGIYHSYLNYSHNLNVKVDGNYLANYYNEAVDRHPVEMRLPYLAAGEHTITFYGSSDAIVATTAQSRISDVTVTPLATGAMADWSGIEFDLESDAKINADVPGTIRLGKLRFNGDKYFGTFNSGNSDFVTGAGSVEILPDAFIMVVR